MRIVPARRAVAPGDTVRVVAGDLRGATGTLRDPDGAHAWWVAFVSRPGAPSRMVLVPTEDLRHADDPRPPGPRRSEPVDMRAARDAAHRQATAKAARHPTSQRAAASLSREAHRDLVLRRLSGTRRSVPPEIMAAALERIDQRIARGRWTSDARYERPSFRRRPDPRSAFRARDIPCDAAELAIIRLLSRTLPDFQFSVTPDGHAFAGHRLGYHEEDVRFYVTALSPVLDRLTDLLLDATNGAGGRMYVRPSARVVEFAAERRTLARLV